MTEEDTTQPGPLDDAQLAATEAAASASLWRRLPLMLCWLLAIWPITLWLLAQGDPELAVRLAQHATTALIGCGLVLGLATLVALVAFPPFVAWLRLIVHRIRLSFGSDRGPLLKALGELQHFESAARHLEVGRLALGRSELQLAATHLGRAVELDPDVAGANYQFGLLLFRIGQVPMARAAFERAERLDPGHAFGNAVLEAGRCALVLGDEAAAVQLLEQHERAHGGNRKSHYWLGKARAANGDPDGARKAMQLAAEAPRQQLSAEDNWFRALARVWLWRGGGS